MEGIQLLALRALGCGGAFVGRCRDGFGCRRMHGMKPSPVHALKHQHVPACIDNGHGDGYSKFFRLGNGSGQHSFRTTSSQAFHRRKRHS